MADQTYFTHVTDIGVAKITNAVLVGGAVKLTHYAVGDGDGAYYRPTPQMTALKNEVWRGNITRLEKDTERAGHIYISAIIPAEVGGFTIREMGVFDADGNMIGIGNTAEVEKVASSSGMSSEIEMTMHLIVTNTDVLQVTVDPSVIIATKKDIEKHNTDPDAHGGVFEPAGSAAVVERSLNAHKNDATVHVTQDQKNMLHSHPNKSTLDGILDAKVTSWDGAAAKAHEHTNKSTLDGITGGKVTNWDGSAAKAHEHANKSTLDGITNARVTNWDDAKTKADAALPKAGGIMSGQLAAGGAQAPEIAQVRNISAGTADLTAGTSPLATGSIYFVYE